VCFSAYVFAVCVAVRGFVDQNSKQGSKPVLSQIDQCVAVRVAACVAVCVPVCVAA